MIIRVECVLKVDQGGHSVRYQGWALVRRCYLPPSSGKMTAHPGTPPRLSRQPHMRSAAPFKFSTLQLPRTSSSEGNRRALLFNFPRLALIMTKFQGEEEEAGKMQILTADNEADFFSLDKQLKAVLFSKKQAAPVRARVCVHLHACCVLIVATI
jgi:hypothetical protein